MLAVGVSIDRLGVAVRLYSNGIGRFRTSWFQRGACGVSVVRVAEKNSPLQASIRLRVMCDGSPTPSEAKTVPALPHNCIE
jgi:hypothetical protein